MPSSRDFAQTGSESYSLSSPITSCHTAKPAAWIDDREIERDLIEPLVEKPREHRGREVAGVLRRMRPERLLADPPPAPLFDRHRQHAARPAADRGPAAHGSLATDLAQL